MFSHPHHTHSTVTVVTTTPVLTIPNRNPDQQAGVPQLYLYLNPGAI